MGCVAVGCLLVAGGVTGRIAIDDFGEPEGVALDRDAGFCHCTSAPAKAAVSIRTAIVAISDLNCLAGDSILAIFGLRIVDSKTLSRSVLD